MDTGKKDSGDGEKSVASGFKVTERKVVAIATEFSPAERRFYDRLEQRTDKSLEAMMRNKLNYASALVLLLRLRQACNHPKLVEGKLEKDRDALAEDSKPKKGSGADVDDLADMFGGLGVHAKHCDICGFELDSGNRQPNSDKCNECFEDLEYFKHHEDADIESPKKRTKKDKKKKKPKSKVIEVVEETVKTEARQKRKPRNRRAVVDSDDEDDEGDWIVSGDEQGPLRLGKAGGTDDENAEGDADTIHSEDSEDDETEDGSRLDSFVVDDGQDTKSEDLQRALEESDSEDEFESVSVLQRRIVERKSRAAAAASANSDDSEDDGGDEQSGSDASDASEADSEDVDSVSESELESEEEDSDSDTGGRHEKTPHVLASAKVRQMITLLRKEAGEHKFIVFSQFTSMLDVVEPFLRKEGLRYARYDGGMRNDAREAALGALRGDPRTRVLLCSLRCGALGLNLTAASRVVLLEPFWNPFVEEQAIDRVHRLTQTVDVVVYKLTVAATVEERILDLQNRKRLLAEQAIEGAAGTRGKKENMGLGLKEMLELFKHVGSSSSGAGRRGSGSTDGGGYGADDSFVSVDSGPSSHGLASMATMHSKHRRPDRERERERSSTSSRRENEVYGRRW